METKLSRIYHKETTVLTKIGTADTFLSNHSDYCELWRSLVIFCGTTGKRAHATLVLEVAVSYQGGLRARRRRNGGFPGLESSWRRELRTASTIY